MRNYRIKQFLWAVTAKITVKDQMFIKKNLNETEQKLFFKLKTLDQKHCIRVAYKAIQLCKDKNIDDKRLIKAALLHDIGKTECSLRIIDKSFLVILDKISKGKLKKFKNIKKVNIYYNHAEIGYEILKKYNYDKKFLELIKNHHMPKKTEMI